LKHSKTKKANIKNLPLKDLLLRVDKLNLLLQNKKDAEKKAQLVNQLVAAKVGSKVQLLKWSEAELLDAYNKLEQKKTHPAGQSSSEVTKSKTPASEQVSTEAAPSKAKASKAKADMCMEGKPQGRDSKAKAHQTVETTQQDQSKAATADEATKSTAEGQEPSQPLPRDSTSTVLVVYENPAPTTIVTPSVSTSNAKIKRWYCTPSLQMVIEREDGARQVFQRAMDVLNMSNRDLQDLYKINLDMSGCPNKIQAQDKFRQIRHNIKNRLDLE